MIPKGILMGPITIPKGILILRQNCLPGALIWIHHGFSKVEMKFHDFACISFSPQLSFQSFTGIDLTKFPNCTPLGVRTEGFPNVSVRISLSIGSGGNILPHLELSDGFDVILIGGFTNTKDIRILLRDSSTFVITSFQLFRGRLWCDQTIGYGRSYAVGRGQLAQSKRPKLSQAERSIHYRISPCRIVLCYSGRPD